MSNGIHSKPIERFLGITENKSKTFGDEGSVENVDIEIPPSLFEGKYKIPFISKEFNLKINEDNLQKSKAINEYILDEMKDYEYEDTQSSYKEVLNNLMRVLGLSKNDSNKLDKLYQAIILRRFFK